MATLQAHDWPGNVRQLENFCRWITVMAPGHQVHVEDLPDGLRPSGPQPAPTAAGSAGAAAPVDADWEAGLLAWAEGKWQAGDCDLVPAAVRRVEERLARFALDACNDHRQEAARRLGWGRNTLTRKLKEFGWS